MKKFILVGLPVIFIIGYCVFGNPVQNISSLFLKLTGNYTSPKYENKDDIVNDVNAQEVIYERLYTFKDHQSMISFGEKGLFQVPFIQVYNEDKKLMSMVSGEKCKWNLIKSLIDTDTTKLEATDTGMYDIVMQHISPLDVKIDRDTFKYYVFAGWANYLPKMKNNLFVQTRAIKDSLKHNVCMSYINLDMLQGWENQ